jgi:uncharacterized protein (DUF2267 family)
MDFDEFTGTIQHRLELPGTGEALRAIRATLLPLGRRIPAGNANDLAASLPMEIKWYLTGAVSDHGERFDWQDYLAQVRDVEGVDAPTAAHHARVVIDLVREQVPDSDFRQLRDALPENEENWRQLFTVVDSGGWSGESVGTRSQSRENRR